MPVVPPLHRLFRVDGQSPDRLLRALRHWLPEFSWSQLRGLLSARRVAVGGALCLWEERRLRVGETVEVVPHPLPPPPGDRDVRIVYRDLEAVVVEKPPRMITLRHRAEERWPADRKRLQPALIESAARLVGGEDRPVPLIAVQRIDRDTSGLVVFARTPAAAEGLIRQFADHAVQRVYRALIPGDFPDQTLRSRLVRDRGDGLRGSGRGPGEREAITTVRTVGAWRGGRPPQSYSELECRLQTGRTHQIRIHLAEAGAPLCGDQVYRGPVGEPPLPDLSGVPRLALHAAELGFVHPASGQRLEFAAPWPRDIARLLEGWIPLARHSEDPAEAAAPTKEFS